ncbi:MAG: hypothetical protein HKP61_20970 [Dactylosporangium sp.]|nr:hypothetical protein [Dactylosporangium sp.]NNJ63353.1 hypothetical protein [Dactylosporangium sp.]
MAGRCRRVALAAGWAIDVDDPGGHDAPAVVGAEPALVPLNVLLLQHLDEVFAELTWRIPPGVLGMGLPTRSLVPRQLRLLVMDRSTSYPYRDAVWAGVVRCCRAPDARRWRLVAIGLAVPGLRKWCKQHPPLPVDLPEVHADLVAGLLTRLATIEPIGTDLGGRLIFSAIGYARRQAQRRLSSLVSADTGQAGRSLRPRFGNLDVGLARVVEAVNGAHASNGVGSRLDPADMFLIGRTRLERCTLAEAAAELGVGVEAAYKRRQRAEALIAEHYGIGRSVRDTARE